MSREGQVSGFSSLDANQPLAVWAARLFFALPYQKRDDAREPGTRLDRLCFGPERSRTGAELPLPAQGRRLLRRRSDLLRFFSSNAIVYSRSAAGNCSAAECITRPTN